MGAAQEFMVFYFVWQLILWVSGNEANKYSGSIEAFDVNNWWQYSHVGQFIASHKPRLYKNQINGLLDRNGKVGIGTNAPNARLEARGMVVLLVVFILKVTADDQTPYALMVGN